MPSPGGDKRSTSHQRGYNRQWSRARTAFLSRNPLCVMCARGKLRRPATVVDHIMPARERPDLFWDESNWQPLCKLHHDSTKQRMEHGQQVNGCDEHGFPMGEHHWNDRRNAGPPVKPQQAQRKWEGE